MRSLYRIRDRALGNYISFYRAYDSEVFIDRILYARRDYMRILFGDSTTDK